MIDIKPEMRAKAIAIWLSWMLRMPSCRGPESGIPSGVFHLANAIGFQNKEKSAVAARSRKMDWMRWIMMNELVSLNKV